MQTQGGAVAAAVIEGSERRIRGRVLIDWNGNGLYDHPLSVLDEFVSEVSTDRALKGSAPEEILLVEGSSAAELQMVIGGEYNRMNLVSVFSRYNKLSPLYGKRTVGAEIKYSLLVETPTGEVEYPQFIGEVRTIGPNRAESNVTITALDRVEKLRKPVTLPHWAMYSNAINIGETDSQVCWSHSIIDLCLRNCDVSPSPKRPAYRSEWNISSENEESLDLVQFFLPGNGSYLPVVGHIDNPRASAWPNRGKAMYTANGPVNPAVASEAEPTLGLNGTFATNFYVGNPGINIPPIREGTIRYWCANRDRLPSGGTHYFGMTLNNPAQIATLASQINSTSRLGGEVQLLEVVGQWGRVYRVCIDGQGRVFLRRTNVAPNPDETVASQRVTVPQNSGLVDIFIQLDNTSQSGSKVYIRAGANSTGGWVSFGSPITYAYDQEYENILGRIQVGNVIDMSDVMYGARNLYGTAANRTSDLWRPSTYAAVLDRGLNRFSHIPSSKATEAWAIITDVAGAEFGSVFWDENGIFRFWNQDRIVDKQKSAVRRFTLDSMETLNMTDTLDSVRNVFIIDASKRRANDTTSVYSSSEVGEFETPAGSSSRATTSRTTVWVDDILSPLTFRLGRYGSQEKNPNNPDQPFQFIKDVTHGFVVQGDFRPTAQYGEGWYEFNTALPASYVNARAYFDHEGFLVVRVDNYNDVPIRFASGLVGDKDSTDKAPQASLNIGGTIIEDYPNQAFTIKNQGSIDRYGVKTLELSGDWYQDTYASNNMITTLMRRTENPIPVTDTISVPGDPRTQLADTIILEDREGLGDDLPAQILGINRVLNEEGLTDVYTVEILTPYDGGIEIPVDNGVTVERVNLNPNPELKNNSIGYYSSRSESVRQTNTTGFDQSTTGFAATDDIIMPQAAVSPGNAYTFSAYVYAPFSGNVTMGLDWYASGGYYGNAGSRSIRVEANTLTRVSVSATAPDGVSAATPTLRFPGRDLVLSQSLYERSASVGTYFDGDTLPPYTVWDGVAGNSTSRYVSKPSSDGSGTVNPGNEAGGADGYTRVNLAGNPAMGANTNNNFAPDGTTGTRITNATGMSRATAMKVTGVATNQNNGFSGPQTQQMIVGKTYTVSVDVKNDGTETMFPTLQVHQRQTGGAWNGSLGNSEFEVAPGATVRAYVTFTVQANTAAVNPYLYKSSQPYTLTGWLYEESSVLKPYFDGDSPSSGESNYYWDNERYNSTSRLVYGKGGSTGSGATETPPANTSGTAATTFGWGTPVAWDVFDYTGIPNPSKWDTYGKGGTEPQPNGTQDGKQCWVGHAGNGRRCVEQAMVGNGYLRLSILPNGDQAGVSHKYRTGKPYGRWEVRARTLPKASSTGYPGHSVLIVWPDNEQWPEGGEYDFFEVNVSDTKAGAYMHYPHAKNADGTVTVQQTYDEKTGLDLTQWHNYAFEWSKDGLKGYIDGVLWFTRSGGAQSTPVSRQNVQDMLAGHLTMQIDNFNVNESGMQEGYLDVEWAKVYEPPKPNPAPDPWKFFIDTSRYQFDRTDPINLKTLADLGYSGNIAKIGQGAGQFTPSGATTPTVYGQSIDPFWEKNRDQSLELWPNTTAGYWYIGNTESPASQAARCKAAIGNLSIPVMLDWENGGGTWTNFLNVLSAFRAEGIKVTMIYSNHSYPTSNGAANIDTATGLNFVKARYWTSSAKSPRVEFDDMMATNPTFGYETVAGGTPDAHQFTQYGTVYTGMNIDVNRFNGTLAQLSNMMHGR